MAKNPEDRRYSKEHEWAKLENGEATIGITDFAQDQLGDVVFVELPEVGSPLNQNIVFGTIESVKAVSDLYAPLNGEITAVNEEVLDRPELVNKDPYGAGWLVKIKPSNPAEMDGLLTAHDYEEQTA
ncbi:MAG: glycine cleavage system protein GcvH [Chloroflexi bacterium]|nr:glycine cleavage system protein GcvH [Chloroflexota bacterium]